MLSYVSLRSVVVNIVGRVGFLELLGAGIEWGAWRSFKCSENRTTTDQTQGHTNIYNIYHAFPWGQNQSVRQKVEH